MIAACTHSYSLHVGISAAILCNSTAVVLVKEAKCLHANWQQLHEFSCVCIEPYRELLVVLGCIHLVSCLHNALHGGQAVHMTSPAAVAP